MTKDATYAVYMPGKNYREIAAKMLQGGLEESTPCVIVANATQSEEKIRRTTLRELALEERLAAPSLLIIGEVARPIAPEKEEEEHSGWIAAKPAGVILELGEARIQEEIIG